MIKGIESMELLPVGTVVFVDNRRGKVIKAEIVPASNYGYVALHTIHFTEKRKILPMNQFKWIPLVPDKTEKINYAGIYYQS